jgi:hypothetical protein
MESQPPPLDNLTYNMSTTCSDHLTDSNIKFGLPNNSYKPITNTRGFTLGFVIYKKGCTRLAAASDKDYQLLAHGRWFSLGTLASSTTKTGRHDIAEIFLKVALITINQSIHISPWANMSRRLLWHVT